jgi:hypothetical protein
MHQPLKAILLVVLAAVLAVIAWGLDRGLDITDESYFLLLYRHPDAYPADFSMFYVLVDRLTGWMHPTVVGYRWITLAFAAPPTLLFSWGFCQWAGRFFAADERGIDPAVATLLLSIGYLAPYGIGVRVLAYNTINNALLFAAAGPLLYVLARAPRPGAQPFAVLAALFVVGACTAFDLFVKFPTAIILIGAAPVVVLLHLRRLRASEIAVPLAALALGAATGLATWFSGVQPVSGWLAAYRAELQAVAQATHDPRSILLSYAREAADLVGVLLRDFSPAFLACLVAARGYARGWHRKSVTMRWLLPALAIAAALDTAYWIYALDLWDSPYVNRFTTFYVYVLVAGFELTVIVATLGAAGGAGPQRTAEQRGEAWLGLAVLAMVPFAGAFGTVNNIFLNALFGVAAWFALMLIAGLLIEERTRWRLALPACVLLPACFAAFQIVFGSVWRPYLLAAPLPAQTVPLREPVGASGLKVDPATAQFIAELRTMLRRAAFHSGDYVLPLYNAPGLAYLMDGISPGTPSYFPGAHAMNCLALATTDTRGRGMFVLALRTIDPETVVCMTRTGIGFPDQFVEIGQVQNPYSANLYGWRLWEPGVKVFRRQ